MVVGVVVIVVVFRCFLFLLLFYGPSPQWHKNKTAKLSGMQFGINKLVSNKGEELCCSRRLPPSAGFFDFLATQFTPIHSLRYFLYFTKMLSSSLHTESRSDLRDSTGLQIENKFVIVLRWIGMRSTFSGIYWKVKEHSVVRRDWYAIIILVHPYNR